MTMKEKSFCFIHNKRIWISAVFAAVLFFCHLFQFIDSGFRIEPLIRVIFCALYPFIVFFFGEKAIPFVFLALGLVLQQFSTFNNYTVIFMISLFLMIYRKATFPVLIIYILDVVIIAVRNDRTPIHILIHFANCLFILLFVQIVFSTVSARIKKSQIKLNLDETDRLILSKLKDGALQKEIEGLSENTVSKRLKKMRERNFCATNQELILRFISESE